MFETYATVTGRLISAVTKQHLADGASRCSFRVAGNERRRDPKTGEWHDGDTLYVSVTCWRRLADNVLASLVVGDSVMVHGRMYSRDYEKNGVRHWVTELDAVAVGPDLNRCTAVVTRTSRSAVPPVESTGGLPGTDAGPTSEVPKAGPAVPVEAGVGA